MPGVKVAVIGAMAGDDPDRLSEMAGGLREAWVHCHHRLSCFAMPHITHAKESPMNTLWTQRYGIVVEPDNILLTSGSQQALDLIGKIFINPGDCLLVEKPTYVGALQAWNASRPNTSRSPWMTRVCGLMSWRPPYALARSSSTCCPTFTTPRV
jgi:hypothetical protein